MRYAVLCAIGSVILVACSAFGAADGTDPPEQPATREDAGVLADAAAVDPPVRARDGGEVDSSGAVPPANLVSGGSFEGSSSGCGADWKTDENARLSFSDEHAHDGQTSCKVCSTLATSTFAITGPDLTIPTPSRDYVATVWVRDMSFLSSPINAVLEFRANGGSSLGRAEVKATNDEWFPVTFEKDEAIAGMKVRPTVTFSGVNLPIGRCVFVDQVTLVPKSQ